jgi:hypothetical protein
LKAQQNQVTLPFQKNIILHNEVVERGESGMWFQNKYESVIETIGWVESCNHSCLDPPPLLQLLHPLVSRIYNRGRFGRAWIVLLCFVLFLTREGRQTGDKRICSPRKINLWLNLPNSVWKKKQLCSSISYTISCYLASPLRFSLQKFFLRNPDLISGSLKGRDVCPLQDKETSNRNAWGEGTMVG